ncbi:hypothetical protein GCM10009717_14270 [Agromyces allii]|uniref:ABC transporter domain-containing protein n=1 Tax=Agromyces allii TaxID=393607 RepID=A0ABP5BN05_9MICO
MTTETTAAERAPRKTAPVDEVAPVEAASVASEPAVEPTAPVPAAEPWVAESAPVVEPGAAVPEVVEPEVVEPAAVEVAPIVEPETVEPDAEAAEPPVVEAPAPIVETAVAASVLAPAVDDVVEAPAPAPAVTDGVAAATAVAVIAAPAKSSPRKKRTLRVARAAPPADAPRVLSVDGLVKHFGGNTAVDHISLDVRAGSFFGIVGPNGAGKTTTLSMVTGLLRPDEGTVRINDIDAWADPRAAKAATGVLPDRLRLFDRLTGGQLLSYSGSLRGLDSRTVRERSADLIAAFGLDDAIDRLVADYSAGMTKKIALACAMIHAPRLLVLDEPFESVDPVSAANLTDILERYVAGGGTVVLSSHGMDLIERVCDSAAIIVGGRVLAAGTLDEVRAGQTLEDRFVELAGGRKAAEGMEWLHSFSD